MKKISNKKRKKKNVLKFLTGTMFNVVMGIILASIVGINPAYGAISGVVIPMALTNFTPVAAALEGVYTEVWTGELVRQMDAGLTASFLDGIPDYSAKVNNEIIQRDYAQGRKDNREICRNFLKAIRESVENESAVNLDFVYGNVKGGVLPVGRAAAVDDAVFAALVYLHEGAAGGYVRQGDAFEFHV